MMSHDLLNDWDGTPEDEKEALLVLKTYHHLVYQLLHMDYQHNIEIIRQHCDISAYFEKHMKSGATPKECNDRILTFLEDKFSRHCEYDEFITILRKLVDMPRAQTTIDQMQKKLKQCYAERRTKEKLKAGVADTAATHTSSTPSNTVNTVVDSKVKPVENGSDSKHQSTTTVMGAVLDNSKLHTSATDMMTRVVAEQLYSTPGFDVLESYKDRVCDSLPADYNTTAVRLQTLIGASNHMIQWVLTGDMSQVNHRIYQIVLVYVWCQPHFIEFCDIMEELADDSITVGHIKALRKDLIRQLYSDEHITAEEASHLESCKLFKVPVSSTTTTTAPSIPPVVCDYSIVNGNSSNSGISVISTTKADVTKLTELLNGPTDHVEAIASTSTDLFTNAFGVTVTEHNSMTTNGASVITSTGPEQNIDMTSHEQDLELPPCVAQSGELLTDLKLSDKLYTDGLGKNESSDTSELSNIIVHQMQDLQDEKSNDNFPTSTEPTLKDTVIRTDQTDAPNVGENPSQSSTSVACISEESLEEITESDLTVNGHVKSNSSMLSDHKEDTVHESSSDTLKTTALPETSTVKPSLHTSGERPQIMTLNSHNTVSDGAETHRTVLTQGTSDQTGEINQLIDYIVDSGSFPYSKIAFLCLTPQQERTEMFKRILADIHKTRGGEVHSKVLVDGDTTSKKVSIELPKEICEHLESAGLTVLKVKYGEMLECFPDNFEATLGALQNSLNDSQICDILSLTTGHNQNILNCLIMKLKSKEDLLDFCDNLEKIPEASSSLQNIVEQLRKEVIKALQSTPSPTKPVKTPKEQKTTGSDKDSHKDGPPKMTLPDHPALLMIPKPANLFDAWQMDPDSEALTALKKCYPIMIDKLPSNHFTTLLRLQDLATLPEKIVENIVHLPSAEVGNKMIVDYLVGLVHTEDHVILFCVLAERMLGEFDNCICILNLRNTLLMSCKLNTSNILTVTEEGEVAHAVRPDEKREELPDTTHQGKEDVPNITSIRKRYRNQDYCQPYLHESGNMAGFKQCITINSDGGKYDEMVKAVAMETPKVTDEETLETKENGLQSIIAFFRKDSHKELSFNLHDSPDDQKPKQYYVDCIEILFKECTTSGVTIYYTGYGEEGTGNWCFKDGTISFQEIFTLYQKYLTGKILCIFTDCSYSGQWVVECAKCLDEMGIEACGHQTRKEGIFIKVYASCQPDQRATIDDFVTKKAVYYNDDDDSIWLYNSKKLSDTQTTCGCDFTKIKCLQLDGPKAPCQLSEIPAKCSWNWKELVAPDCRPGSRIFTVRGNDGGRKAWHLVLVERKLLESFREAVATGNIDVAKFGYVIKSGWGKDPPGDVLKNVELYSPNS